MGEFYFKVIGPVEFANLTLKVFQVQVMFEHFVHFCAQLILSLLKEI